MAVLQVFQAKLLRNMDESGPSPDAFKEVHTDLVLRGTEATTQAICKATANLVVLNLRVIRDADRVAFLESPVSPKRLFGPAVNGFAELLMAVLSHRWPCVTSCKVI